LKQVVFNTYIKINALTTKNVSRVISDFQS